MSQELPNTEGSAAKAQNAGGSLAAGKAPGSEDAVRREMGLPPRSPISLSTFLYAIAVLWVLFVLGAMIYASAQTGSYPTQYLGK